MPAPIEHHRGGRVTLRDEHLTLSDEYRAEPGPRNFSPVFCSLPASTFRSSPALRMGRIMIETNGSPELPSKAAQNAAPATHAPSPHSPASTAAPSSRAPLGRCPSSPSPWVHRHRPPALRGTWLARLRVASSALPECEPVARLQPSKRPRAAQPTLDPLHLHRDLHHGRSRSTGLGRSQRTRAWNSRRATDREHLRWTALTAVALVGGPRSAASRRYVTVGGILGLHRGRVEHRSADQRIRRQARFVYHDLHRVANHHCLEHWPVAQRVGYAYAAGLNIAYHSPTSPR